MSKKVALALAGGGARGIAHIGVIEVLEEKGYEISAIAGTSMGALIAGTYAMGELENFKNWLLKLDKLQVFKLVDFNFSGQGLVKGDRVFDAIREVIPDQQIEDLDLPFKAVATDIINQKEIVFDSGSVFDAIRASIAIPTVLTPIQTEEGLLVDGGVLNNLPLNHVARADGDLLVAVDISTEISINDISASKPQLEEEEDEEEEEENEYLKKIKEVKEYISSFFPQSQKSTQLGFFDLLNSTLSVMMGQIAKLTFEKQPPDLLLQIPTDACTIFDFYKAEELVALGRQIAEKALEEN